MYLFGVLLCRCHACIIAIFHCCKGDVRCTTFTVYISFLILASAIGEVGQPFISTLEQNQTAFFQYTLPEEGLTLRLEVETGLIVCFVSNRIENPNEALYDFRVETSRISDVYISLDNLQENSSTTIYISCEGRSGINNFTLNTTSGDTTTGTYVTDYL